MYVKKKNLQFYNNKRGSSSKTLLQVNVKLYPWQWTSLDNIWAYWENSDLAIIFGTRIREIRVCESAAFELLKRLIIMTQSNQK